MSRTSGPRTLRTSMPPGLLLERVLCSRCWGVVGSAAIAAQRLSGAGGETREAAPPQAGQVDRGAEEGDEAEDPERELRHLVLGGGAGPRQRGGRGQHEGEVAGERPGEEDRGRAAARD